MTDKEKIADLEKRVKDLEARPQAPTIIVLPANPFPVIPQYPVYPQPISPWIPYQPWWDNPWYVNTCGAGFGHPDCTFTSSPLHMALGFAGGN